LPTVTIFKLFTVQSQATALKQKQQEKYSVAEETSQLAKPNLTLKMDFLCITYSQYLNTADEKETPPCLLRALWLLGVQLYRLSHAPGPILPF
jgi:hypothetical protein